MQSAASVSILDFIDDSFRRRPRPERAVSGDYSSTELHLDALAFSGMDWRELSCAALQSHTDAVFGFSPEAFCYYLPGIPSAGIRVNRPDLLVNGSLIMTLDRGTAPESWDDLFRARWPTLASAECEATQKWILWLEEFEPPPIEDASLSRAFDTMDLLAHQSAAIPIAGRSWKSR
jgi:hypothetical protein